MFNIWIKDIFQHIQDSQLSTIYLVGSIKELLFDERRGGMTAAEERARFGFSCMQSPNCFLVLHPTFALFIL